MGNSAAVPSLSSEQLQQYVTNSVFTSDEVRALWSHFHLISSGQDSIDRNKFQAALMFRDTALLDRIFRVVDQDDDNQIDFTEYLLCVSTISHKMAQETKLEFSFEIYDFDSDGFISSSDLTTVLAVTLKEHDLVVTKPDIDEIVELTMKEAQPAIPGLISYPEYRSLVLSRPHLLSHFTINISNIISEYSTHTGKIF